MRGSVVDASGAQVSGAKVHAESLGPVRGAAAKGGDPGGQVRDTTADATGHFLLALPGGNYTITVQSPGFDPYVRENLRLDAGQHVDLAVKLLVATIVDVVNVPSDASSSTDPADNKSALVFKGDQLQVFSDDDKLLQQELTAVAGGDPSLPPQILVDGFSNGQFPPKSSIREIRINQNPFSAQYDAPGDGRVEVFTKPGSNSFHGFFALYGNDNVFNARNPYVQGATLPYYREHVFGDVSGPLGKKTSFDLGLNYIDDHNNTPINATALDSSLNTTPVQGVLASPSTTQNYTARLGPAARRERYGHAALQCERQPLHQWRRGDAGPGLAGCKCQHADADLTGRRHARRGYQGGDRVALPIQPHQGAERCSERRADADRAGQL